MVKRKMKRQQEVKTAGQTIHKTKRGKVGSREGGKEGERRNQMQEKRKQEAS